jgi:L-ascorbate metabolism protein UlaG (beta-lactamase superfamily)
VIVEAARRAIPFFVEQSKREVTAAPQRPRPDLWPDRGLHAAWLGHSTVLLKIDGLTILTDPVFSNRIGLNFGPVTIGFKRLVASALTHKECPRPDLVLLSHAHMDHFDLPSLRSLESKHTQVVTAHRTSDLLRAGRYGKVHELRWNETTVVGEARVRAFEVRHWGARMRSDTFRGYNGYVIETPGYRVIFGGDTAMTDSFRQLRSSEGFDLAIMPIGAYDPWIYAHCNPEQALHMANEAGAEFILPVHHRTFRLSSESTDEPIERLTAALSKTPERLVLGSIGAESRVAA